MAKQWTDIEVVHLTQYETSSKSAYTLFNELRNMGFNRTFKAVKSKLEALGFHKPPRYVTGHEKRLGYLDIETTNLKADVGIMLSWAIKTRDSREIRRDVVTREELFEGSFDARICQTLSDALNNYDLIFTYYGTRFDIPFMRTRAEANGVYFPVYRELSHKDLYYMVRSKLKLHRNSLKAATHFYGIQGKTDLDVAVWAKARYGDEAALKNVLKHNIADVVILERLHKKLEPYCPPTVRPI